MRGCVLSTHRRNASVHDLAYPDRSGTRAGIVLRLSRIGEEWRAHRAAPVPLSLSDLRAEAARLSAASA
jgi:hypothetical protein